MLIFVVNIYWKVCVKTGFSFAVKPVSGSQIECWLFHRIWTGFHFESPCLGPTLYSGWFDKSNICRVHEAAAVSSIVITVEERSTSSHLMSSHLIVFESVLRTQQPIQDRHEVFSSHLNWTGKRTESIKIWFGSVPMKWGQMRWDEMRWVTWTLPLTSLYLRIIRYI